MFGELPLHLKLIHFYLIIKGYNYVLFVIVYYSLTSTSPYFLTCSPSLPTTTLRNWYPHLWRRNHGKKKKSRIICVGSFSKWRSLQLKSKGEWLPEPLGRTASGPCGRVCRIFPTSHVRYFLSCPLVHLLFIPHTGTFSWKPPLREGRISSDEQQGRGALVTSSIIYHSTWMWLGWLFPILTMWA